jgi:hypothetical protein
MEFGTFGSDNQFPTAATAEHKYTEIKAPYLAVFAVPHDANFAAGVPSSSGSSAHIFNSNEADVFRVMNDFLDKVPKP